MYAYNNWEAKVRELQKFQASLDYTVSSSQLGLYESCLKNKKQNNKQSTLSTWTPPFPWMVP